ncbi:glycosyltransferase family 2 protein [Arenimonas fontis]|uniref:Glycosyltransferase family 2 protein n=1 Tax=Arenimonas fontis TaxID=2608255 RepID=A0A5B2ZB28_9GAMM|nr:glycosyltransferase family 2 protein [Arenimonas fontis]KAA2284753.1 glycosyltransferase family 2 protein [Arenimonas fontis]
MAALPLTLAVITHNEADCIGRCLDSVPFAAEKLVVDSLSDDDTVAVARAHGARVVEQAWLGFGPQRNFASTQASHDWILVLDADEYLSPELAKELQEGLPALMAGDAPAAILRRRTLYMGKPMRWYRPAVGERLARLYHRGRARWTEARVHESLRYEGRAAEFRAPFEHVNNPTLAHKQLKVLRYAELKCRDWLDKGKPARMWQAPLVYPAAFLKDYLLRLGCLDGWRGFVISHTAASYALYKRLRYYEMKANPDSVAQAARVLKRHGVDR